MRVESRKSAGAVFHQGHAEADANRALGEMVAAGVQEPLQRTGVHQGMTWKRGRRHTAQDFFKCCILWRCSHPHQVDQ